MIRRAATFFELILWRWYVPMLLFLLPWGARLIFFQPTAAGQTVEGLTLSLYAIEVLVWGGGVLLLFVALGLGWRGQGLLQRRTWPIYAWGAWCVASVWWAPDTGLALQHSLRLFAAGILYFLVVQSPRHDRLRAAFVAGACVQALLAIFQHITQTVSPSTLLGVAWHVPWHGPAGVVEYAGGRLLRAYGTFPHPNVLGGYLALGLLVSLSEVRENKWARAYTPAAILCTVALLLTFSRSGILAAVFGSGLLLFGILVSPHLLKVVVPRLAFSVGAALLVLIMLFPFFAGRVAGTARLENRSLAERTTSLLQGKELWLDHALSGVGVGNATVALMQLPNALLEPPHAVPLIILVELGSVGFLVSLILLFQVLRRMERTPRAIALVAALAVLAFLDHYLWTSVPGLFFGVSALALATPPRES